MVYVYLGFWDKFPETKLFNHRLSTSSILVDMDKSPPHVNYNVTFCRAKYENCFSPTTLPTECNQIFPPLSI